MNETRWMFICGGLTIYFGRQRKTLAAPRSIMGGIQNL